MCFSFFKKNRDKSPQIPIYTINQAHDSSNRNFKSNQENHIENFESSQPPDFKTAHSNSISPDRTKSTTLQRQTPSSSESPPEDEQQDMNFIKKFIKEKKADKHFKKAGTGFTLGDEVPPQRQQQSAGPSYLPLQPPTHQRIAISNATAEAAARRLEGVNSGVRMETAHQRKIRELAKKQLEEEMESERKKIEELSINDRDEREFDHSSALKGVYFTCDLFDEEIYLPKSEMLEQVELFLRSKLDEEGCQAASVMLHTLISKEKRDKAISTLDRVLKNIINNPGDEKYRKIKTSGKVFNESVMPAKGAVEFLNSLGFKEVQENGETYLVLSQSSEETLNEIGAALEMLTSEDCRAPIRLYRNPKIYRINPNNSLPKADIPEGFFTVSGLEIKAEQERKTKEADKLNELRTREMREKDSQAWKYTYKYTLIRVRFPNQFIVEGTFGVYEKFGAVREFISDHLNTSFGVFHLTDPAHGGVLLEDEEKSLGDYGLIPAALLMFFWDDDTVQQFASMKREVGFLAPEFEDKAVPLE